MRNTYININNSCLFRKQEQQIYFQVQTKNKFPFLSMTDGFVNTTNILQMSDALTYKYNYCLQ